MFSRIVTVFGIIPLCVFLIIGCAGHKQIVQQELLEKNAPFVGMHYDELLKSKGLPTFKVPLSIGEEVWMYQSTKAKEDTSFRMDVGGRGGSAPEMRRPMISWTETVSFTIGEHGTVKNVSVRVEYTYF
ncbi:MAG: hypothetical protein ACETWD_09070 [Desulfatiglandales bacterium]